FWWLTYGHEAPNMRDLAIKILSLTCSASGCERNWSIFEHIHTKKRNKLDHERMESLVFIKYNQQLIEMYNLKDEVDPIALNDIDEWLVGEIGTATFRDDSVDDDADFVHQDDNTLSWNLVFEAMGGNDPTTNTRRQQNRKRKEPATARGGAKGGPSGSKASKKGKGKTDVPNRIRIAKGGEALADVMGREEDKELPAFQNSAFEVDGGDGLERWRERRTLFLRPQSPANYLGSGSGTVFVYSPSESGDVSSSRSWFTYEELIQATDEFSPKNLLGEGGFGAVYKGTLFDGRVVAVKQLKVGGGQGERKFRAEVEIISRVHHRHLVSLVGYCISEHQRLLVYDYVANNTLHYHFHGENRPILNWPTRVKVGAGAARGIAYLHEDWVSFGCDSAETWW
ncbi:hypothetical protein S245_017689, partial [Arachis hypogaea]